jgi:hypothetical protein
METYHLRLTPVRLPLGCRMGCKATDAIQGSVRPPGNKTASTCATSASSVHSDCLTHPACDPPQPVLALCVFRCRQVPDLWIYGLDI